MRGEEGSAGRLRNRSNGVRAAHQKSALPGWSGAGGQADSSLRMELGEGNEHEWWDQLHMQRRDLGESLTIVS